MPLSLLNSQLATLERPTADENVLEVNLGATPGEEVAEVLGALEGKIKPSANPTLESPQG
jgi:gluconokinase